MFFGSRSFAPMKTCFTSALKSNAGKELFGMSTTRYKIRLWEYDGEASVANAVTFDSFDEAQARFNDLRVSEEMPCVEFIKERIANGCIIGDEVLNVRQFTSVFDAITKDKPTLAGFLRSLPCIEAPWDAAFQKRYCSSCTIFIEFARTLSVLSISSTTASIRSNNPSASGISTLNPASFNIQV